MASIKSTIVLFTFWSIQKNYESRYFETSIAFYYKKTEANQKIRTLNSYELIHC